MNMFASFVVLALLVSACGSTATGTETTITATETSVVVEEPDTASVDGPPPEPADKTFMIEPLNPQAGETFEGTFVPSTDRGGFLVVSQWSAGEWLAPLYSLESDANGGPPQVRKMEDPTDEFFFEDYGVDGPGPDGFVMPDDIEAGQWRLCVPGIEACAQVTIE